MYIYIFGSICRGEIDENSDIDLLAIVNGAPKPALSSDKFSIYTIERLTELWNQGNPFSWHLYLESKLVFNNENVDIIREWGKPNPYINLDADLKKFSTLFSESLNSLRKSESSMTFDLSMIFLAIRNFATCYCLGHLGQNNFSRYSAILMNANKLSISPECFRVLERARILSTRGVGQAITEIDKTVVLKEIEIINSWFKQLQNKV